MAEKKAPVAAAKAEEKKTSTEAVKTEEPKKTVAVKESAKAADTAAKAEKKPAAKKAPAKKATAAKKTTAARKPAARKTAEAKAETAVILQYGGREFDTAELTERVKNIWTGELGKKAADLKDVKLYVKPEEYTAYYVINGDITGSFDL